MTTPRSTTRPDVLLVIALGGLFAFALGFSLFWRPQAQPVAPRMEAVPTELTMASTMAITPAPTAAPAAPTPTPTAEGYIIGTEAPQLAPAAPALAEPAVVYSDLIPIPTEPAGWHPPFVSGYSPTQNFVEVRP